MKEHAEEDSSSQPLSEQERLERLAELDATPSENPKYKGLTPGEAVKVLLQPKRRQGRK